MTNATLAKLLPSLLTEIEGSNGFWHGQRDEVAVYVVADEEHDRMRVMSPVGELKRTDAEFLSLLLQANFDRALDAKYALRRKELWSVFMHPLSTLVPDDLGLYLDQVVRLVKNTGSTYASSDLVFGIGDEEEGQLDVEFVAEGEEDDEEGEGTSGREDDEDDEEEESNGEDDDFEEDEDEDDEFDDDEEDEDGEPRHGPGRVH